MTVPGPTRLVLLRAGKYDYGEVELARPLHLIGPNNVGKTSLIATLQFLYIDDQRQMQFSRDLAETRRYYFPDTNAYVLFECLTPTGFQVFGVHGLGPLKQYEIQRFAYQGRYDPADFLGADRRVREAGAIRTRLADRGYTLLEPRHLRAALTGIGRDNRGVDLGLVPLRHRDHYERFRTVFRNLLRLAHLRQEELKAFLIEIHAAEFQQKAIDLERDYAGQYQKVRRGADELRDLQAIAPEAQRLLGLAEVRDGQRREMPALWRHLGEVYAREETRAGEQAAELTSRQERLAGDQADAETERGRCQDRRQEAAEERGGLRQRLEELAAEAETFRDFLPDFERARSRRLEGEIEELGVRLRGAQQDSPSRLRTRIARAEGELREQRELLEGISRTLAARLSRRWAETDLDPLFRLLNPALLGLPEGGAGVEVLDPARLEARLATALGKVAQGAYRDDAVRVALGALPAPDLAAYTRPERVAERLAELESDLERDRSALEAAEDAERLRARREQLRTEFRQCERTLQRYADHLERREHEGPWRTRFDALGQEEDKLARRLETLERDRDALAEALRQVARQTADLEGARRRRREALQRLAAPPPEWTLHEIPDLPDELDALASRYAEAYREERRASRELADGLSHIQARTYGRYDRETEGESLAALAEELEALEERTRAVQELWKGLAAGLRSAFKALNRDLETLESRVDQLNRSLAGVSVSNLARLQLRVREHPEWVKRIRTVAVEEELPLFSERGAVDAALAQLGELLSHYPRVRLSDLFNLHFEVTTPDGAARTYPHLDNIESNGTTIAIKVLVNLMLLRGLLGQREVSLPFYLDEVSSLDHENLTGIVDKALELGFVPVLASPEAMDAAENLYFLTETRGRVLLDPKSALVRIRRETPDADIDPEGTRGD